MTDMSAQHSSLNILVLHHHGYFSNNAINLQALPVYAPEHLFHFHDITAPLPDAARNFAWDAVFLSFCALGRRHAANFAAIKAMHDYLRDAPAVKVAFPQDDYIRHRILDAWLADWKVDLVYTPMERHIDYLYPETSKVAEIRSGYTGYIDDRRDSLYASARLDFADRPYDFGNRINRLPATYGRHGLFKGQMNELFGLRLQARGLRCDVSTNPQDRFFGDDWMRFLGRVRYTLAAKGGVSVDDPDGSIHACVARVKAANPDATFEEIEAACFPGRDGVRVFDAIGPRILQAAQMGACQIMPVDDYPGGLEAGRDYIVLERDMANFEDVLAQMRDIDRGRTIAARARDRLMATASLTYSGFIATLFDHVARLRESAPRQAGGSAGRNRVVLLDLLEEATRADREAVAAVPELLAGLTARLVGALATAQCDRVLKVMAACEDARVRPTFLAVQALGFDLGAYSNPERSLILLYIRLAHPDSRRALAALVAARRDGTYPVSLATNGRNVIAASGGEWFDFHFKGRGRPFWRGGR